MMEHPFLNPVPRIVAHRGDSEYYPENTLPAFRSAFDLGVDVIETDVHLTKDGHIVIWHDPTLERNTNGSGTLESHTLSELKSLDAGYTFTKDGGRTFPFRGQGVQLATLDEALRALPYARFNIDLKSQEEEIVETYIRVIRENHAEERVCTASFHFGNLARLREKAPDFLTSITTKEVVPLVFRQKLHILQRSFDRKVIFQIPVDFHDEVERFVLRNGVTVDRYFDSGGRRESRRKKHDCNACTGAAAPVCPTCTRAFPKKQACNSCNKVIVPVYEIIEEPMCPCGRNY